MATADFDRWKTSARQFAQGFTPGQKAVTAIAVVAVVAGGLFFMSFAGKPSYAPLFTNLQPADAAAITSKLNSDHVPYQLQNGGTSILVPQNKVDQERINMAQGGLPAGTATVGLGILDKEGITTSELTQQADYLRALQGELSQTIGAIHGVTAAQVNLALPANNTFALNNNAPTGASVLVSTAAGQQLNGGEVQAIVHLVASSVPNLSSANVTVADSNGNLLAGPGVSSGIGSNNTMTSAYNQDQQAKIAAFLQTVLGPGNAAVQVNALLNFDKVSTTTKNILATGPANTPVTVPTHTVTSTETLTGGATAAGGALGSTTAVPGGTGSGNYTKSSTDNSFQSPTSTQTIEQAPGTVKNQTVAVVVNTKSLPAGVSLATLRQEVAAVAHIDPTRGDSLSMSSMPFSTASQQAANQAAAAAAAAHKNQQLSNEIRTGAVALVIALALFLLWRSSKKAKAIQRTPITLAPPPNYLLEANPAPNNTVKMPAMNSVGAQPVTAVELDQDVGNFVDAQPDDVAALLRSWMEDRSTSAATRNGS
ncbi:MAG: flagellar basal-body MS-ring/collar protein FliF [Acidimicrobiales bacterium]